MTKHQSMEVDTIKKQIATDSDPFYKRYVHLGGYNDAYCDADQSAMYYYPKKVLFNAIDNRKFENKLELKCKGVKFYTDKKVDWSYDYEWEYFSCISLGTFEGTIKIHKNSLDFSKLKFTCEKSKNFDCPDKYKPDSPEATTLNQYLSEAGDANY